MASLGIAPHVISRILNHMETGVTAVYNRHSYDAEKRDALETWEKKYGRSWVCRFATWPGSMRRKRARISGVITRLRMSW